jgi:hypothetical protein
VSGRIPETNQKKTLDVPRLRAAKNSDYDFCGDGLLACTRPSQDQVGLNQNYPKLSTNQNQQLNPYELVVSSTGAAKNSRKIGEGLEIPTRFAYGCRPATLLLSTIDRFEFSMRERMQDEKQNRDELIEVLRTEIAALLCADNVSEEAKLARVKLAHYIIENGKVPYELFAAFSSDECRNRTIDSKFVVSSFTESH